MTADAKRSLHNDDETLTPPTTRSCLKCHNPFLSAWAGERVCKACKNTTAWRSGSPIPTRNDGVSRNRR